MIFRTTKEKWLKLSDEERKEYFDTCSTLLISDDNIKLKNGVTWDSTNKCFIVRNKEIKLGGIAHNIAKILAENYVKHGENYIVPYNEVIKAWGNKPNGPTLFTIRNMIKKIRDAVGEYGVIVNHSNRGYSLS